MTGVDIIDKNNKCHLIHRCLLSVVMTRRIKCSRLVVVYHLILRIKWGNFIAVNLNSSLVRVKRGGLITKPD